MSENQVVYEALSQAQKMGNVVALATVIKTTGSVPRQAGSKMLIQADGSIVGTIGGGAMEARVVDEAKAAMQSGEPRLLAYALNNLEKGDPGICGGTVELFIEPIGFVPTVVVIGCGHVGKALAELAKWSGFRVLVSDDRVELCSPQAIPNMDGYYPVSPTQLLEQITLTPRSYVAAVTRGLPVDMELFPTLLESQAAYIGLIGSRRRWEITKKAFIEAGLAEDMVARIHSPIGLEIEAETPQEIAISIMAEIISIYRTQGNK